MDDTIRLVATFLGALVPSAVGVAVIIWRLRAIIPKALENFEHSLVSPTEKVQQNTDALNRMAEALSDLVNQNRELRRELKDNQTERIALTDRLRVFADTVDEMLLVDKDKTSKANEQMGKVTEELRQIKVALAKCLSDLAEATPRAS